MTYEVTTWKNTVYDDEGNELQKGTPYSAENMNKIEQELLTLDTVMHDHPNKKVLNTVTQELLDDIHEHQNMPVLKHITQTVIDDTHKHANKTVLDKVTQKHLDDIAAHGVTLTDHERRLVNIVESVTNLKIKVVQTIAERNALVNKDSIIVHVVNATADTTVISGWAQYIYQSAAWIKIAENESIDVLLSWAALTGKPTLFPPAAHEHPITQITGLQAALDAKETPAGATAKAEAAKVSAQAYALAMTGLRILDNRAVVPSPVDYASYRTTQEFKNSTAVGLAGKAGTFVHVFTERAWNDQSGGYVRQLAYDGYSTKMWTRYGNQLTNIWSEWDELETTVGSQAKVTAHANDNVKHISPDERTKITEAHDAKHAHANKLILDLITQAIIDNSHNHANKTVLDALTQAHLTNTHTHSNATVLASITQALLNQIHTHTNKALLDKITYSGAKPAIDLILLEELAIHTHEYASLLNKPIIPTQTSQLTNNSQFPASNAARITVSATAPVNPQPNDIWIVI
ncbi:hypothetical protein FQ087_18220 [Sporosarcina sp. ANT_H38]|uniref:hypothetical protein n=1 Tax=Sporosarcina sp. ANT_H38 TaxID=2597358 RepID=UPI0011F399A5|nr:hypothetical protein [Sporosarcina sp. ANT_H38]KAA0944062.1 hypothetical protein FQ087_18220 [Sporosarcina sp. ANT_H38]